MTTMTHETLVSSAPARRSAHALPAAVILLALGALLLIAAAVISNGMMQRLLVSIGSDPARDLAWGPTLFRALLACHGLLLVIGGVLEGRRQRQVDAHAVSANPTNSARLPLATALTLIGILLLALALRLAAPGDAAVAMGMAGAAFRLYVAPDWPWVKTQDELDDVRSRSASVWVIYTTPIHMKAWFPELWDDVQRDFTPVKQFPGTLGGGTVYVCRQKISQAAEAP